jgi:GT2 family glycosyltransferase
VVIECFLGSGSAKKLFLIDNSLTNRLEREIPLDPRIQYEHNDRNTGYVAHNVAMRKSIEQGFKYHVVLNPDISCDSAVFQKISQFMDNSPDVGLLLPKIFYPDGRLQYACKLLPTPRDFLLRLFFPRNWIEKQMNTFELRVSGYDKIMDVPYMSGCFMFLRNSVLEKVGLFDERFFMYAEDIDLSRRIHAESRSVFYPDVSIVHRHEAASYKNPRLFWIHLKNVCQYFNKYGWFLDKHRRSVNRETLAQFEP